MISLKKNRVALVNLDVNIQAIDTINSLIEKYSVDLPGPAHVSFNYALENIGVQFDRRVALNALQEQRLKLVEYFTTLGIDANN